MTVTTGRATAANWSEPEGVAPRGTLIVIPGRGEGPELYERFGRRIAGDAYRCTWFPTRSATPRAPRPRCLPSPPRCVRTSSSRPGAIFTRPQHPYTEALLDAIPALPR